MTTKLTRLIVDREKDIPSTFTGPIILAPKPGLAGRKVIRIPKPRGLGHRYAPLDVENNLGSTLKKHGSLPHIPIMPVASRYGQMPGTPKKKQRIDHP